MTADRTTKPTRSRRRIRISRDAAIALLLAAAAIASAMAALAAGEPPASNSTGSKAALPAAAARFHARAISPRVPGPPPPPAGSPSTPKTAVTDAPPTTGHGPSLPAGWHEVARPLTGILYPVQVFAAATYRIVFHHRPQACGPPRGVLAQMPPSGALLQIIEYAPRDGAGHRLRVPRLPRRPHRFSYADATWALFECAGLSYKFDYRQDGRALQAQVWMHRATVSPAARAGALRILNNFRP